MNHILMHACFIRRKTVGAQLPPQNNILIRSDPLHLFIALSFYLSPPSFLDFPSFFSCFFQRPIPCFLHPFIYPPTPVVSLFSFPLLAPVRGSINLRVRIISQHEEEVEEEEKGEEGEEEKTGTIQSYIKT